MTENKPLPKLASPEEFAATPTCRGARAGNKLAAVHDGRSKLSPEDLATRDALLDRLLRERGGRSALDIVSQLRIEDYATAQIQLGKVTRRLETLGAVSTAGNKRKSLVDTYTVFSARVERLAAELPPIVKAGARRGLTSCSRASRSNDRSHSICTTAPARRTSAPKTPSTVTTAGCSTAPMRKA